MRSTASTPYFSRVEAGLCESTVSEQPGMCSRSEETSVLAAVLAAELIYRLVRRICGVENV